MGTFKKITDTIKKYAQATYDVFSGKAEQDRLELKKMIEEGLAKSEELMVLIEDGMALKKFTTRKAADYFNEAAAKEPDMSEEYKRFAHLAATVDPGKMRGRPDVYPPGEEDMAEWHRISDRFKKEIKEYAEAHIEPFVAENPERWERILKARAAPKPPYAPPVT